MSSVQGQQAIARFQGLDSAGVRRNSIPAQCSASRRRGRSNALRQPPLSPRRSHGRRATHTAAARGRCRGRGGGGSGAAHGHQQRQPVADAAGLSHAPWLQAHEAQPLGAAGGGLHAAAAGSSVSSTPRHSRHAAGAVDGGAVGALLQAPDCKHGIASKIKIGLCAMDKKVCDERQQAGPAATRRPQPRAGRSAPAAARMRPAAAADARVPLPCAADRRSPSRCVR